MKTKILISASTLKRIFGKNKTHSNYFPQEATLLAMENYAEMVLNRSSERNKYAHFLKPRTLGATIIIVFISVMAILAIQKKEDISGEVMLEVLKIDGNNPATVYFKYDFSSVSDSVFLNYGDSKEIQHLNKADGIISHYYRFPGSFTASIETRKDILSEPSRIFIPTKEWMALGYYFEQDAKQRFFPIPLNRNTIDGNFQPSRGSLASIGMDSTQIVVVRLDNFRKTSSSGDSFTLKTRFKNGTFWPAIRCYSAFIYVFGDEGEIGMKFVNEGCSIHSELVLGEKSKHGSNHDLTNLSINISKWQDLKITNSNKTVEIELNGNKLFVENYNKSIGNINGVSIQFHGIGTLDYVVLTDSLNQDIFYNYFD